MSTDDEDELLLAPAASGPGPDIAPAPVPAPAPQPMRINLSAEHQQKIARAARFLQTSPTHILQEAIDLYDIAISAAQRGRGIGILDDYDVCINKIALDLTPNASKRGQRG